MFQCRDEVKNVHFVFRIFDMQLICLSGYRGQVDKDITCCLPITGYRALDEFTSIRGYITTRLAFSNKFVDLT
jgi:hypothetical protein